jgi:phosphate transport system permease protein
MSDQLSDRADSRTSSGLGQRLRVRSKTSLFASGEPMIWLTGGALAICGAMVAGLLLLVLAKGLGTFWPAPLVRVELEDGQVYMGEITREEEFRPSPEQLSAMPDEIRPRALAEASANEGRLKRQLFRIGNYKLTQSHFAWVSEYEVKQRSEPDWALLLERLEWGVAIGEPEAFVLVHYLEPKKADGSYKSAEELAADARELARSLAGKAPQVELLASDGGEEKLLPMESLGQGDPVGVAEVHRGAEAALAKFAEFHGQVRERWERRREHEKHDIGEVNHLQEEARLEVRKAELALEKVHQGGGSDAAAKAELEEAKAEFEKVRATAEQEFARLTTEIQAINRENSRYRMVVKTPGAGRIASQTVFEPLDHIVRLYPANHLSLAGKLGVYFGRWHEFLTDEPREANSEGGVFPAIFGTVAMTLIMSLLVVPFGVLAALYLREYAKPGLLVTIVRIAVNNLAGVPSIVFGVFGLGFFCYVMGGSIDDIFFAASLPNPTFGKGGLMWASLTLALLTLPVVIVATEEAVAAVPKSMREGSFACGASKWQTIQRIVLPRAMPGIITGMVLAIARGAGEVAPLMLVGAVKLAPELPVDGIFPFMHPERSFMHLGFHIFDVGFQSQNSEAAKPMVFTTTLLLIAIVALLNFAAIWLRSRLRRKFAAGQF